MDQSQIRAVETILITILVWFLTVYEVFAHTISPIISLDFTWKSIWWVGILDQKNGGLLGPWGLFGGNLSQSEALISSITSSTNFYFVLPRDSDNVNNPGSLPWGGYDLVQFSPLATLGSQGQRIRGGRSHHGPGSWRKLCGVSSSGVQKVDGIQAVRGKEESTG